MEAKSAGAESAETKTSSTTPKTEGEANAKAGPAPTTPKHHQDVTEKTSKTNTATTWPSTPTPVIATLASPSSTMRNMKEGQATTAKCKINRLQQEMKCKSVIEEVTLPPEWSSRKFADASPARGSALRASGSAATTQHRWAPRRQEGSPSLRPLLLKLWEAGKRKVA